MEAIAVALIAAGPATLAAFASWRSSARAGREVASPNGLRTAEMVASIYKDLSAHINDRERHA